MTARRHDFLERYSAAWALRADARRRDGSSADHRIADALERIVASMRAELASLPADAPAAPPQAVTWRSPVFNVGGRFNPFAGTHAEAMLASADVCDRIGEPAAAAAYRRLADGADPEILQVTDRAELAVARSRRSRPTWSGPNLLPSDPVPFVAGPQLGLFA